VECEAAVADYFDMLKRELRGESVHKAEHRRALAARLGHRSESSIERKHQNISAVLIRAGQVYISGYKPLGNFQELLGRVVLDRIVKDDELAALSKADVERSVQRPEVTDPLTCEERYSPRPLEAYVSAEGPRRPPPRLVNWFEREACNASLGRAGEEFVLAFEQARLQRAGQRALAQRVEHVARTQGDGAGFDILSFEQDGRERLIEVKTTSYGLHAPFFVTRTEQEVSSERSEEFQLYRVFEFRSQPRLVRMPGALEANFRLDPSQFRTQVA